MRRALVCRSDRARTLPALITLDRPALYYGGHVDIQSTLPGDPARSVNVPPGATSIPLSLPIPPNVEGLFYSTDKGLVSISELFPGYQVGGLRLRAPSPTSTA